MFAFDFLPCLTLPCFCFRFETGKGSIDNLWWVSYSTDRSPHFRLGLCSIIPMMQIEVFLGEAVLDCPCNVIKVSGLALVTKSITHPSHNIKSLIILSESDEVFLFIDEDGQEIGQFYIDPDVIVTKYLLHLLWYARGVFLGVKGFSVKQRLGIISGLIKVCLMI